MGDWEFAVWERPKLVVNDFIYIRDSQLVIYTVERSHSVFVRNLNDNKIIGILPGHSCVPVIAFVPEKYLLFTGDQTTIKIWKLYEDLIGKYDMNPPWTI